MGNKKTLFWIAALAAIVCVAWAICFLVDWTGDEEDIFGRIYSAQEIIYDAPPLDFTYSLDTTPDYCFTADHILMERGGLGGSDAWTDVGVFREVRYSSAQLAALFVWEEGFHKDWSLGRLGDLERIWRIEAGDKVGTFWLVMETGENQVFLATGYGSEIGDYIRWLWRMERQSGGYDGEYLSAQIEAMCGGRVQIFALYERDGKPGYLLAGFLTQEGGAKKGFALFRYDSATDGYVMRGFDMLGREALGNLTIGEDLGLDHSVTIVLSSSRDLAYATAEAEGERLRENNAHSIAPAMLVFEWPEILEETAVEVHYYNFEDKEIIW